MKLYKLFVLFLALRTVSVFFIQTSYVPDEYWQCLEVSHKLAFGYGHLTWEWTHGLRSYIYPVIIAGLYKILQYLQMDTVEYLILLPRMFQGILSAIADVVFCKLLSKLLNRPKDSISLWAAYAVATSWFWYYCASRTLSDTLETVITVFGLYNYPWSFLHISSSDKRLPYAGFQWYIPFVVFACLARPTAVINWSLLCYFHLWLVKNSFQLIIRQYLSVGLLLGISFFLIDSYFYDRYIFVPWNFVKLNLYDNVGALYGIQPSYWYIMTGFPVIMGFNLLPFLIGFVKIFRSPGIEHSAQRLLAINIIWTLFIYSFIPHKEFRFLLSLLPMALVISATMLSQWSRSAYRMSLLIVAALMLVSSVVPGYYFGMVHNRGTLDVMKSLAKVAHKNPTNTSVLFLMPCHSTPLYSHLHVDIPAKFLTCEPDFSGTDGYLDEAELFYKNPDNWLKNKYVSNDSLPTHIVCFDTLFPALKEFLNSKGFRLRKKFVHTQYPENSRVGENINLYARK